MAEITPVPAETPAEPTIEDQIKALVAEEAAPQEEAKAEAPALVSPGIAEVEEQLKTIEAEAPKSEEPKPALTDEQETILKTVPSVRALENLNTQISNYHAFTGAFEKGDFDSVEEMFQQWRPEAYEAFLNHIYTKKVTSEEWVNRWILDKEVPPSANAQLNLLQKQIQALQAQLQGRQQEETQQQKQVSQQQVYAQYNNHVKSLFDTIKTPEGDRNVLADLIVARVNRDDRVRSAILSGNAKAVNSIFAQVVREFNTRDQATKQVTDSALKAQEVKKLPATTMPSTETTYTEEGYNAVPKAQRAEYREQLEQQALANLYATRGKGKR